MKPFLRRLFFTDLFVVFSVPIMCLLIKLMGEGIFKNETETASLLVLLSLTLFQIFFFFIYSLEFINRTVQNTSFSFNKYILSCLYILLLIQITFALNYLTLYKITIDAFKGIEPSENIFYLFANCIYFSAITFATIGYGDITPLCLSAKMLVTLETFTSMLFVIFIFANFSNFKSNFSDNKPGIRHLEEMDETKTM